MVIFATRLFYLQIIKHNDYVAQAAAEQIKPLTIPAKRGLIYAMDGTSPVPLVINQTVYTMFADPSTVNEESKVLSTIRQVAGGNLRPNLEDLLSRRESRYQILGTQLTRQQAELIKKQNLTGIGFQEESQRVYPEGSLASQTLGFVNTEGKGQYGIEQSLNDRMTGHDGLLKSVTDVSGVPLTIGNQNINKPAQNGDNIALTIDRNIQAYTEKALAAGLQHSHAPNGSVVVMDPQSGKVLAMANLPTYDPSQYNKVTDASAFDNPIVSTPYEPGSDIKTFTMATGLDKGVVTPDSTYNNTDSIKIGDRTITNATKGQTGNITFQHALNYSLNTGFVTVEERLGDGTDINDQSRNTMYDYFHNHFGFAQNTGIEVAGEAPGIIIPPTSADGNAVRYSNMAFGQGLDITMIQVASGFSALVNGGTYYQPTVVGGTVDDSGNLNPAPLKAPRRGVITAATSATIHDMIHTARQAFYAKQDKAGYDIGGKTGTSQTLVNGQYVDNQTVATYLGYGGDVTSAKYVIMVQVSGPGLNLQGNLDALPIFTNVSNWLIDYLKLQPKG
ncbi:MAG: putative Peptidoglycan glycosyltransferase [Candidatus Saccharibacteria bacterium]|nr:putative Peptidoglycan glycosyltransferase [Candidatus Saccharibacteria bacterium]